MSAAWLDRLAGGVRLVRLSARLLAGRRYWVVVLLPLLWSGFLMFRLAIGWRQEAYGPSEAQGTLIGLPLAVLAIGLGVRVVAGELERRTLEIAYTVPGGAQRVWLAKLAAALVILLASEALLAVVAHAFFTGFPAGALYGALQSAVFYLVLAMGLATWFRSEVTGAMAAVAVLTLNGLVTGFGGSQLRSSPFWNPLALEGHDAADVLAWTIQNRIGFVLAIAALTALAFARAERREKLL